MEWDGDDIIVEIAVASRITTSIILGPVAFTSESVDRAPLA
jgi:hypothetical protein